MEGSGGGGGYVNECVVRVLEDVMLTIVEDEVSIIAGCRSNKLPFCRIRSDLRRRHVEAAK